MTCSPKAPADVFDERIETVGQTAYPHAVRELHVQLLAHFTTHTDALSVTTITTFSCPLSIFTDSTLASQVASTSPSAACELRKMQASGRDRHDDGGCPAVSVQPLLTGEPVLLQLAA
jgi:hypothetical protein